MIIFKLDLGNHVVLQDYRRVDATGTEYSGHGVFLVDSDTGELCWWFFDSDNDSPAVTRGRRAGEDLVMAAVDGKRRTEHRFAVVGEELTYRIVVSDESQPAGSVLNG